MDGLTIEELAVERFQALDSIADVFFLELHPDMAIRVLLDVDPINLSKLAAHRVDLVFDIHKVGRVALQVDLRRVKHALEHKAVRFTQCAWLFGFLACGIHLSTRHECILVPAQLLHESGSVLCGVQIGVCRVLSQVFLLVGPTGLITRSIRQNINLKFLIVHKIKTIH